MARTALRTGATALAMAPQPKPEAEEDCKVCKKGKKGSAAFGALMAQRGIALPGTPKPG